MHLSNSCGVTIKLFSASQRRHLLLATSKRRSVSACIARAMRIDEAHRMNSREQKLRTFAYQPDKAEAAKAVLIFHHGYGEHLGRYKQVFGQLVQRGIAVHAQEAHGHGDSEPKEDDARCLVWDYRHLVDDCEAFAREVRQGYPAGTVFVMGGQSMGGLVAAHTVLRDQSVWQGLALCSAAVDVEWTLLLRLQAPLGGLLARWVPRARIVAAVSSQYLSQDPEVVRSFKEDPYNFVGPVRARTGNELLKGFRDLQSKEHELGLPIYAHHGNADRITSLPAVRRLLENCCSDDVTLNVVEHGYHELFLGPEKEQVTHTLSDWLLSIAEKAKSRRQAGQMWHQHRTVS